MLLATIVLQASAALAAALGAAFVFRRRSAALRHWILAVGLFYAAAMPALQWLAPDWVLPDSWSRSYAVTFPAETFARPVAYGAVGILWSFAPWTLWAAARTE